MASQRFLLIVALLLLLLPRMGFAADDAQYVIEPPDILRLEVTGLRKTAPDVPDQLLVRPDGTISLGSYGTVPVAGRTLPQVQEAVASLLREHAKKKAPLAVRLEVASNNSRFFYLVTDGQVTRHSLSGNETVASTVLATEGLAAAAAKGPVRIVRAPGKSLDVDWHAITQAGILATNYQLLPGDRLYVGE